MKESQMIAALAALAHKGRLKLFRRLVQAGTQGQSCGNLAKHARVGITTASAQLQVLANASLVSSQRQGKSVIYYADYPCIARLMGALLKDCCSQSPGAYSCLQREIETAVESGATHP